MQHHLIGNKKSFAIEIELNAEWNNKTALWLNGNRIGDWEDENLLAPFLISIRRLARKYNDLWVDELKGVDYYDAYQLIFFNHHNGDLFGKFDKFKFSWGENFDSLRLTVVYENGKCNFMWLDRPYIDDELFPVANIFKLESINIETIQQAYNELTKIIPDDQWPIYYPK